MFIGRKNEIALLQQENWRDRAQLIVIYGRRRVGKTALVEKAYENELLWKFEGLEDLSPRKQIRHFLFSLGKLTGDDAIIKNKIDTWEEALLALDNKIGKKKVIIFFDEFQWLASMRKQLVSIFKWAWDNYLKKHKQSKFILCGSVSSFIIKKVLGSSALYGRIDTEIHLKPFSLPECNLFFQKKRLPGEVMEIFMTMGGIPQYLLEVSPGKSLIQNLNDLAFVPHGYFYKEYQRLFISHFSKNLVYEKILRSLARKNVQKNRELANSVKLKSGGTFTTLIDDLEMAGFIERFTPLDKPSHSRLIKIRIVDEFLHFYFTFIESNKKSIEMKTIKGYELLTGPVFSQWQGYAFEQLCIKHAKKIAAALGFSGIRYEYGSWFHSSPEKKAQIDLMFKRGDKVLTICELKYVNQISSGMISMFEKKIAILDQYFAMPIQKVLISGKKIPIPDKITGYFDRVLFAEDIFFRV